LEEKPVGDYRNVSMYRWFLILLDAYLRTRPIAKLINLEMGFRLQLPHKVTIRKPDLFIILDENPIALGETERSYHGIGDLCVESLSDSTRQERERDTVQKKAEYAAAGVHEYYILDAGDVHMAFYRLTPAAEYAAIDADAEGVIRSEVLAGFQFRVLDLYRQPSLIEMAEDSVYQDFVLPQYQAEKQRAEQEYNRAEQEYNRAEHEYARAERLAARLRALGIDDEAA